MKRRNVDSTKNRKQFHFRKCKFAEGMVESTFLYLKFVVVWVLIMVADYLLEFRFEFLWPFWLLIRSLHDSIKYQGIIFSVFFALVAFLADFLFYMFLPVQWLFFAASTYVWVQYVWHTEKGICLPTVSLWLLFIYIEASLRLKSLKTVDMCRPFAAHCIAYPMVTLGFGFKSYLSYKFRLKKQKEIQKLNNFHMQLIAKALPLELQLKDKFKNLKYEEDAASQQTLSSSTQSSIFGALCSLKSSSSSSSTNSTSQIQQASFNNANQNIPHSIKNKNCDKSITNNQNSGLIASALSFYLNSSSINNNNNNNNNNSNLEDDPYIQQNDSIKGNFSKSNKFQNHSSEQSKDYSYSNNSKNSFKSSYNNFNDAINTNNNSKPGKSLSQTNNNIPSNESSVNCKVSSFSISSLPYESAQNEIEEENCRLKQGSTSNQTSKNNNSNGNLASLNGNLVLLSNSKIGDENNHDHKRSSSTSSNSSSFLSNSSNNHTNININMTINATAIAAAAATATANAPKTSSVNLIGTTKNRKNKEKSSNNNHRANSVASSTSSSSSSSSVVKSKLKNENDQFSFKDDLISRLEEDLKKFKAENEQQKSVEQYLRNQINYVTKCDRLEKLKLEKIQQENKTLQIKINKTNLQSQKDKEELEATEKRLKDEKRLRINVESQLAQEIKNHEAQETKIQDLKSYISSHKNLEKANTDASNECSADQCANKLKEIGIQNKKLIEESRKKQERILSLESELKNLSRSRETETRVDTLMVALNLMEDKNISLQESLSAETRFKLDLFSALGEARRQLESVNFQLKTKERELQAFKTILKQSLSASENSNQNNNILNTYLNGSNESNQILTSNDSSNKGSLTTNLQGENTHTTNAQTEWNGSNSNLTFLPKI